MTLLEEKTRTHQRNFTLVTLTNMVTPALADLHEHLSISYVTIMDTSQKTFQTFNARGMDGEKESRISVQARPDDDDDPF